MNKLLVLFILFNFLSAVGGFGNSLSGIKSGIIRHQHRSDSCWQLRGSDSTRETEIPGGIDVTDTRFEKRIPSRFDIKGVTLDDGVSCSIPTREIRTQDNRMAFEGPVSHQVLMQWEEAPRRVLLLVKPDVTILLDVIEAIEYLTDLGLEIVIEDSTWDDINDMREEQIFVPDLNRWVDAMGAQRAVARLTDDLKDGIDLVVAFGGDGLLMHCNTLFPVQSVPPVMCIDFGSLGFLSPFDFEEFKAEIARMVEEQSLQLTMRMRLECTIQRSDGSVVGKFNALNEVLIDRGPSPFLSAVDLFCAQKYITTVQGDGIIIATPTGSTAYSLAAGGSMLHPSIPAILVTPICPHTLSFRPLVLPDSSTLSCVMPTDGRSSGWISFDGKYRQELQRGDMVDVKMCNFPVPTVNKDSFTSDWFDSLSTGFNFNLRVRQKQLESGKGSEETTSDEQWVPTHPRLRERRKEEGTAGDP